MSSESIPAARFRLGRITATPHALEVLTNEEILAGITRHQAADWGDVNGEDRSANEVALIQGTRLWSVYHSAKRVKFWIITEADRSLTTVLMPEDY